MEYLKKLKQLEEKSENIINPTKILEDFIFGEEALKYDCDENWIVRRPIKFGYFNVAKDYSIKAILKDI